MPLQCEARCQGRVVRPIIKPGGEAAKFRWPYGNGGRSMAVYFHAGRADAALRPIALELTALAWVDLGFTRATA